MISIVIPVYNAEKYILNCLESISLQTYQNYEVILVNDGSTDYTETLIKSYIEKKPNWLLISKENGGVSETRNIGIANSKGDYLVFIDADDYVDENYLQKLYEPFKKSDIQLTCCGYTELSKNNITGIKLHDFQKLKDASIIDKKIFYENLFTGVTGVLWGKMFLSKIIKDNTIRLNEKIHLSEDLVFVFEYVSYIQKIGIVNEHLYYYNRLHESGLSSNLDISNLLDLQLTDSLLKELGSQQIILNLQEILNKRFVEGIIKIVKGITSSKNTIKQKISDLKVLANNTKSHLVNQKGLNKDNRIILKLLKSNSFFTLLFYNFSYQILSKLKNNLK